MPFKALKKFSFVLVALACLSAPNALAALDTEAMNRETEVWETRVADLKARVSPDPAVISGLKTRVEGLKKKADRVTAFADRVESLSAAVTELEAQYEDRHKDLLKESQTQSAALEDVDKRMGEWNDKHLTNPAMPRFELPAQQRELDVFYKQAMEAHAEHDKLVEERRAAEKELEVKHAPAVKAEADAKAKYTKALSERDLALSRLAVAGKEWQDEKEALMTAFAAADPEAAAAASVPVSEQTKTPETAKKPASKLKLPWRKKEAS